MIVVVMGVTGVGKTTVGRLLAHRLGWHFEDGDDFHPQANVEKMRRGAALDDDDRTPWLAAMGAAMRTWSRDRRNVVLACSALKRRYRDLLYRGPDVRLVYLKASHDEVRDRLRARQGHFADERILANQFAILEEPEEAITVPATLSPEEIVAEICPKLGPS